MSIFWVEDSSGGYVKFLLCIIIAPGDCCFPYFPLLQVGSDEDIKEKLFPLVFFSKLEM